MRTKKQYRPRTRATQAANAPPLPPAPSTSTTTAAAATNHHATDTMMHTTTAEKQKLQKQKERIKELEEQVQHLTHIHGTIMQLQEQDTDEQPVDQRRLIMLTVRNGHLERHLELLLNAYEDRTASLTQAAAAVRDAIEDCAALSDSSHEETRVTGSRPALPKHTLAKLERAQHKLTRARDRLRAAVLRPAVGQFAKSDRDVVHPHAQQSHGGQSWDLYQHKRSPNDTKKQRKRSEPSPAKSPKRTHAMLAQDLAGSTGQGDMLQPLPTRVLEALSKLHSLLQRAHEAYAALTVPEPDSGGAEFAAARTLLGHTHTLMDHVRNACTLLGQVTVASRSRSQLSSQGAIYNDGIIAPAEVTAVARTWLDQRLAQQLRPDEDDDLARMSQLLSVDERVWQRERILWETELKFLRGVQKRELACLQNVLTEADTLMARFNADRDAQYAELQEEFAECMRYWNGRDPHRFTCTCEAGVDLSHLIGVVKTIVPNVLRHMRSAGDEERPAAPDFVARFRHDLGAAVGRYRVQIDKLSKSCETAPASMVSSGRATSAYHDTSASPMRAGGRRGASGGRVSRESPPSASQKTSSIRRKQVLDDRPAWSSDF